LDYAALLGTFLYCLFFALFSIFWHSGNRRIKLAEDTIKGSGVTLFLMLVVGIGSLINFDQLFYDLHLLIFKNTYWGVEGNMLLLFPGGFWYDGAIFCFSVILAAALVLGGISWFYLKKHRTDMTIRTLFQP
jgi:uncharacterized membrane protein